MLNYTLFTLVNKVLLLNLVKVLISILTLLTLEYFERILFHVILNLKQIKLIDYLKEIYG